MGSTQRNGMESGRNGPEWTGLLELKKQTQIHQAHTYKWNFSEMEQSNPALEWIKYAMCGWIELNAMITQYSDTKYEIE